MGIFDKYKDVLIPGCKVNTEASSESRLVLECNTEKILGEKTFKTKGQVEAIIERGKIFFHDDGGLPAPTLEELKSHIRRNIA